MQISQFFQLGTGPFVLFWGTIGAIAIYLHYKIRLHAVIEKHWNELWMDARVTDARLRQMITQDPDEMYRFLEWRKDEDFDRTAASPEAIAQHAAWLESERRQLMADTFPRKDYYIFRMEAQEVGDVGTAEVPNRRLLASGETPDPTFKDIPVGGSDDINKVSVVLCYSWLTFMVSATLSYVFHFAGAHPSLGAKDLAFWHETWNGLGFLVGALYAGFMGSKLMKEVEGFGNVTALHERMKRLREEHKSTGKSETIIIRTPGWVSIPGGWTAIATLFGEVVFRLHAGLNFLPFPWLIQLHMEPEMPGTVTRFEEEGDKVKPVPVKMELSDALTLPIVPMISLNYNLGTFEPDLVGPGAKGEVSISSGYCDVALKGKIVNPVKWRKAMGGNTTLPMRELVKVAVSFAWAVVAMFVQAFMARKRLESTTVELPQSEVPAPLQGQQIPRNMLDPQVWNDVVGKIALRFLLRNNLMIGQIGFKPEKVIIGKVFFAPDVEKARRDPIIAEARRRARETEGEGEKQYSILVGEGKARAMSDMRTALGSTADQPQVQLANLGVDALQRVLTALVPILIRRAQTPAPQPQQLPPAPTTPAP